ncbi:MAG: porin family protein, partial [Candidatus Latescibacterota bacterium]
MLLLIGFAISLGQYSPDILANAADSTSNQNLDAQRAFTEIEFGIKAGFSLSQHSGVEERGAEYDVSSDWREGAGAGAFLYLPITRRFGLQQELLYVQKGSRQDITVDILDIPTVLHVTYDMDYIEIPVLFKFAWLKWRNSSIYS